MSINRFIYICLLVLVLAPMTSRAGVPELIHPRTGEPLGWDNPYSIPYWLDQGDLGRLDTHQATELIEALMGVWEAVPSAAIRFQSMGSLDVDVTADNVAGYLNQSICADNILPSIPSMADGVSPIIFDNDGRIIELLAGKGSSKKIVGKSAFRCFWGTIDDPDSASQAFLVMNGLFVDGDDRVADLSTNAYAGVILHELGHYIGLHHTMINHDIFVDVAKGKRPLRDTRYVPVMFPLVLTESSASTVLKPDDVAALTEVYPEYGSEKTRGEMAGRIEAANGQPVRGAVVVARDVSDPLCRAYATISGRYCTPVVDGSGGVSVMGNECGTSADRGDFYLRAVPAGQYSVEVNEVPDLEGARAAMFPKNGVGDLSGNAEFYNIGDASNESWNEESDVVVVGNQVTDDVTIRLDAASGSERLRAIPLSAFTLSTTTHCTTDPVDYNELIDLAATLSTSASTPSIVGSSASGGCQLVPTRDRHESFPMVVMAGMVMMGLIVSRSRMGGRGWWLGLGMMILSANSWATVSVTTPVTELNELAGTVALVRCESIDVATDSRGLSVATIGVAVEQSIKGPHDTIAKWRLVMGMGADEADLPKVGERFVAFVYPESEWGYTSFVGGAEGRWSVTGGRVRSPWGDRSLDEVIRRLHSFR